MARPPVLPAILATALAGCGADTLGADAAAGAPTRVNDADGDGLSTGDGDCDDLDASVHPGAKDRCDGVDSDCDGQIDEDFDGDTWEPNDDQGPDLGALEEDASHLVYGYLSPASDVDRFRVRVEDDDFSWFSLEAWLYGVPADADYALELRWVKDPDGVDRGIVAAADEVGDGGYEDLDWGGEPGEDDGGTYEIVVRSTSGSACEAPYTLELILGQW
jgi:hypothetical protein